jgi:hypothetical protein
MAGIAVLLSSRSFEPLAILEANMSASRSAFLASASRIPMAALDSSINSCGKNCSSGNFSSLDPDSISFFF